MAETSDSTKPPEELHWGISYLREDIQDLRQEIRGTHNRIDEMGVSINQRIDTLGTTLGRRIDELGATLGGRIDATNEKSEGHYRSLNQRIDDLGTSVNLRFDEFGTSVNQRIDSRFTILLTTLLTAMIALTGVVVAAIKL